MKLDSKKNLKKILKKVTTRSFFLQAVWNYEKMQGIGFLYSILPALKAIYGDDSEELKNSCQRHVGYFNTHPYMANLILGYVVGQELKIKENPNEHLAETGRKKLQLAGPLAALGDKVFWSTWRPLVGLITVALSVVNIISSYYIPFVFLILYNLPIYFHRKGAIIKGVEGSSEIANVIERFNRGILMNSLPYLGFMSIFICIAVFFYAFGYIPGILVTATTLLVVFVRKIFRVPSTRIVYGLSVIVIIWNMIF